MLDEIIIRPIQQSDNQIIASIIRKVLIEYDGDKPGTAFNDKSLLNMYDAYQSEKEVYFVAITNGQIVGGCGIKQLEKSYPSICELQKMYIRSQARGKMIGKQLLDICLNFAVESGYKKCYLETFSSMHNAINLYKKNNFRRLNQPIGTTGHDACNTWMVKDLI